MNKADAIKKAKAAGLTVTKEVKTQIGGKTSACHSHNGFQVEFYVGSLRVHHDGDGGAGCWKVDGVTVGLHGGNNREWTGRIAHAIQRAVELQVAQQKAK